MSAEERRPSWESAAEGWRRYDLDIVESSRPVAAELIRRAGVRPGQRVLDLACGTGEPALSLAELVGPRGSVLATDLAEPMLEFARKKAADRGLDNIEFRIADAEALDVPPASFDSATMRWGLMYLARPERAVEGVHRALVPGGRVAFATWGPPEENPMFEIPRAALRARALEPAPTPGAPGLFALADPQRLASLLTSAGFQRVGTVGVPTPMTRFPTGAEAWEYTRAISAPIATGYLRLAESAREEVDREVAQGYDRYRTPPRLEIPGLSWVGWGTK